MYKGISSEKENAWNLSIDNKKAEKAEEVLGNLNVQSSKSVGIPYIHNFVNTNRTNCAQAAIAVLTAFYKKNIHSNIPRNIYDTNDQRYYPENNAFVNAIFKDYPNDGHFFDINWTWKEQIEKALNGYGLNNVGIGYAAAFTNGQDQWNEVFSYLSNGYPVIVMFDINPIKGEWGYHYAVLFHFDGTYVYLTNMGSYYRVDWNVFMEAWHCGSAPYPNNFVYITATS